MTNKEQILQQIKKIEKEEKIKVVFLTESGSRAWGWESKDSDYDIRGVFIQDYEVFNQEKNQINRMIGDLDIELWDLKKFFRLMTDSNPGVWEWLSSDITYVHNSSFEKLKKIYKKSFNSEKLKRHYVSMARQNFEKYINKVGDVANLKKYVYVLRSIACVNFLEKENLPPPKNYKEVIAYLPENLKKFFEEIVREKVNSEKIEGPRNQEVENYIISFWGKNFKPSSKKFDAKKLNLIFKKILKN